MLARPLLMFLATVLGISIALGSGSRAAHGTEKAAVLVAARRRQAYASILESRTHEKRKLSKKEGKFFVDVRW